MKIALLKYSANHIKITLDNGETFKAPVILKFSRLKQDQSITDKIYNDIKHESELKSCSEKLFRYLSQSDKSISECKRYLKKKEYSKEIISSVIEKFIADGFLDDSKFAIKYIDYLNRTKLVGKNYIIDKLYKKGINKSIIDQSSTNIKKENDYINQIYVLAEKKMKSIENKKNKFQKLVYFLQSRGFENKTIFKVIELLKNNGYSL